MKHYTIREFVPETNRSDMDALLPAYLSIWNNPENLPLLSFTGQLFAEAEVRGWFSNKFSKGVSYFGAVDDSGVVLGVALTNKMEGQGLNIGGIGVLPEHKGNGIGKELVMKCMEQAKLLGCEFVNADVFANNIRMLRLLLGFEFVPHKMDYKVGKNGAGFLHLKRVLKASS